VSATVGWLTTGADGVLGVVLVLDGEFDEPPPPQAPSPATSKAMAVIFPVNGRCI